MPSMTIYAHVSLEEKRNALQMGVGRHVGRADGGD